MEDIDIPKKPVLLFLMISAGCGEFASVPEELFEQVQNNSPTQEQIDALVDIAMHYYWHGGDLEVAEEEFFQGITLHDDYDVVAESFRQATVIDPVNIDLKRSLAAAQVL